MGKAEFVSPDGKFITLSVSKFAAIIRHFGEKFEEGDEEAAMLKFPIQEWAEASKARAKVLFADDGAGNVGFTTYVEKTCPCCGQTKGPDTSDSASK